MAKAKENGPAGGGGASAGAGGASTNSLGSIPNGRLISRRRRGKVRRKAEGDNFGMPAAKALVGAEALSPAQETLAALREASGTKLITTEVFAAAYVDNRKSDSNLTHAVLVDDDTNWDHVRPLCNKAKNIMDDASVWTHEKPTCASCASKWAKMKEAHPEYMSWKET